MITLTYVQDPGHGWIGADRQLLDSLGLADRISEFSYSDGPTVWLEEDCDAPIFLRALTRAGIQYSITETHTRGDAWIRSLPRFEG